MTDRWLLALISDTHANSTLSLMHPEVELLREEGPWTPEPTTSQKIVWDIYDRNLNNALDIAGKSPIVLAHLGDPVQGLRFSQELVSTRAADQLVIAEANLAHWLKEKQVKACYLIRGTGVHEMDEGSASELLANMLSLRFPKKDIRAIAHPLLNVKGLSCDLAHHGAGPGIRHWLKGNVLRLYVRSLMMDELAVGNEPPGLVARGHYHEYVPAAVSIRQNGKTHLTYAMIVPSYSFLSDYARKVRQSPSRVTIGMVLIEIIGACIHRIYDSEPEFMETVDLRRSITIG